MDAHVFWIRLRQSWLIVIGVVAFSGVAAFAFASIQSPAYSARSQLFVSVDSQNEDASTAYLSATNVQERVKSYAELVDASAVLNPVRKELGLSQSNAELATMVAAASPSNTKVINVTARSTSAVLASELATPLPGPLPRKSNASKALVQ